MITILGYFTIIILGMWFFLSIIAQFRGINWIKWIIDRDPFDLIPSWTFFAPNPSTTDYKLLYRDKLYDGKFMSWKDIPFHKHSILNSILNSEKSRRKAITNCCISLLQSTNKYPKDKSILSSVPYRNILTYIMSLPKNPLCEYRQFLIVRSFGYITHKKPDILFVSKLYSMNLTYDQ